MPPSASWTDTEVAEKALDDVVPPPDLARTLLINALAVRQGRLSLPELRRTVADLAVRTLARALREAALDGIVRIEGKDVYLTPLGQRVAKSL